MVSSFSWHQLSGPSGPGRAWPILAGLTHVSAVNRQIPEDWLVNLASSGMTDWNCCGLSVSSRRAWAVYRVVKGLWRQQESQPVCRHPSVLCGHYACFCLIGQNKSHGQALSQRGRAPSKARTNWGPFVICHCLTGPQCPHL